MSCVGLNSALCVILNCWAHNPMPYSYAPICSTAALSTSINDFGANLTQVLEGQGNVFTSPLSIYIALAMIHLGAGGFTAQQLQKGLDIPKQESFHQNFQHLLTTVKKENDDFSLYIANGLFLQHNFGISQNYKFNIKALYNAEIQLVDFISNGYSVKNKINSFVTKHTHGKLSEILKQPPSANTMLFLINAVYFKGIWETEFPKSKTSYRTFYLRNGGSKEVKFMELNKRRFNYFDDQRSRCKFLELPYKGGFISMIIALQDNYGSRRSLVMTSDLLSYVLLNMDMQMIDTLRIPKLNLKYKTELVSALLTLGIYDLFTPMANLSGISEGVRVSDFEHEAFIEVNEQGSEAAAISSSRNGLSAEKTNNVKFIVDQPYSFFIIDKRNGLILFSGCIVDPH